MPLYEYQCEACQQRFEVIQKFSDPPAEACRLCGKGPVQRLISSPAIQFKGSGWYITDYSQKGKPPASTDTGAGSTSEGKDGKDASKTPAKTESSGESAKPAAPASSASSSKAEAS
jgi:putative FmdB family regulatory protein